jgi:hypothetical protein
MSKHACVKKYFLRLGLTSILILCAQCNAGQKKSLQAHWGQNAATVKMNELSRLEKPPLAEHRYPHADITTLVYDDRFMHAHCRLAYWFDMDSLQIISYSCSNPDWDETELRDTVAHKLSSLYGEPVKITSGEAYYDYYQAKDAHIYFRMIRIPQDREMWRTFQANIVYSHYPHESYKTLRTVLAYFGNDKSWR